MSTHVGIVGGGQLGRMLAEAAKGLGLKTSILDPTPHSPAAQVADKEIVGDFRDYDTVVSFSRGVDALTYEIELANAEALEKISTEGLPVHPTPRTLSVIKDKLRQKTFLKERGIAMSDFAAIESERDAETFGDSSGYPFVLKSRSGGYDGRGNATVSSKEDIAKAFEKLGRVSLYAETFVPFEKELAIIAARTVSGEIAIYPLVETVHKDHICHMVLAPALVSEDVAKKAHEVARQVLEALDGAGVFGIELFLAGGNVLVNEIAPRVHNSGHFTIEACATSQFEQHMRVVSGMPLGPVEMRHPAAVMINILGERNGPAEPRGAEEAALVPGAGVHLYGKIETRVGRKMGHVTAVGRTLDEARTRAEEARAYISI